VGCRKAILQYDRMIQNVTLFVSPHRKKEGATRYVKSGIAQGKIIGEHHRRMKPRSEATMPTKKADGAFIWLDDKSVLLRTHTMIFILSR
jgi:hypothetical protein